MKVATTQTGEVRGVFCWGLTCAFTEPLAGGMGMRPGCGTDPAPQRQPGLDQPRGEGLQVVPTPPPSPRHAGRAPCPGMPSETTAPGHPAAAAPSPRGHQPPEQPPRAGSTRLGLGRVGLLLASAGVGRGWAAAPGPPSPLPPHALLGLRAAGAGSHPYPGGRSSGAPELAGWFTALPPPRRARSQPAPLHARHRRSSPSASRLWIIPPWNSACIG